MLRAEQAESFVCTPHYSDILGYISRKRCNVFNFTYILGGRLTSFWEGAMATPGHPIDTPQHTGRIGSGH